MTQIKALSRGGVCKGAEGGEKLSSVLISVCFQMPIVAGAPHSFSGLHLCLFSEQTLERTHENITCGKSKACQTTFRNLRSLDVVDV